MHIYIIKKEELIKYQNNGFLWTVKMIMIIFI